jgi:predicted Ser/Thr protein kinase
LLNFVSPEHRSEEVPCHFIPLNETGETIETLEPEDNQAKLERDVAGWLRVRIRQIEEERSKPAAA